MSEVVVQVVPLLGVRSLARRLFDYKVSADSTDRVRRGSIVQVSFGGRNVQAVVMALGGSGEVPPDKLLTAVPSPEEPVGEDLLELAEALAGIYLAPLGSCIRAVAPSRRRRGAESGRLVSWVVPVRATEKSLSEKQRAVLELAPSEGIPITELCTAAGTGRGVVQTLIRKGLFREERRRGRGGGIRRPAAPPPDAGGRDGRVRTAGAPPAAEVVFRPEQVAAADSLLRALDEPGAQRRLLWGVTGSGKTEIYLRLVQQVLEKGGGAIVLVPEIALTPQIEGRFRARFGDAVGLLHSRMSGLQRAEERARIGAGEASVVVGARSAVLAPVRNLRLVIIDEAHDSSYKQEEEPRYDARTVAWWRIEHAQGLLVEGSATPRVEALAAGRGLLKLRERPSGAPLPALELIDMRRQGGTRRLAPRAAAALREALQRGEQAIVLLNRRGYASFLRCDSCGRVVMCPRCELSLTYHRAERRLLCHQCGWHEPVPAVCPRCGQTALSRGTPGTERLADELLRLVPRTGLFRLDSDVATSSTRVRQLLDNFAQTAPAVLIGTQMVAKGHDFPKVTVVVVADADTGLYIPDFRAAERTFQLITQVAGRAGRGSQPGRCLVQTWNPEVACIKAALEQDYAAFYREELQTRRRLGYPPFGDLIRLVMSARQENRAAAAALHFAERLRPRLADAGVRGPARLPVIRGRSRWQLLLSFPPGEPGAKDVLRRLVDQLQSRYAARGVDILIDVEPQWFS